MLLPDGCCHLTEATDQTTSSTANLLLVDTDLATPDVEGSAVVVKIIFDNIEDHLRVAKLETLPTAKAESLSQSTHYLQMKNEVVFLVPTYVKAVVDILLDSHLDDEAFETMIMQQKIKYLK